MMKQGWFLVIYCLIGIGSVVGFSTTAVAIDAYFDTEISTRLEPEPYFGTVRIRQTGEEVPQVFPEIQYEPVIYMEIIFDASKTMGEPDINGIRKLDIAKEIATILVNKFPLQDTRFALRVNGAQYDNNCLDSELVVPFQRDNAQQVLDVIASIQPKGISPITYSLRQVLHDFVGTKGTKIVFMITDGQETCDVEPVDTCTATMDIFLEAEFEGAINIVGINTIYDDAKLLLSCLSVRGGGDFLDSNRNKGPEFAELIRGSQQLGYSISRVLDPDTLAEGKVLELYRRRIGDRTILDGDNIILQPESRSSTESYHELLPGIYKIEFATIPPMASYFTLDSEQELTIALVRSGRGIDLYDRAHMSLGNRYYDDGEFEKAMEEYQTVLEFDPTNVDAHLNMGIIYDDIVEDKEKAAEHYKAYLELQGPRQDDVREWLRKVRGQPTQEQELEEQRRQREEEKAREEAERLAREEAKRLEERRQQGLEVREYILTKHVDIRELSEEDVLEGDIIRVVVADDTLDPDIKEIAVDVGFRIKKDFERTPQEVVVYREENPDVAVARARYDSALDQYVLVEE
jgi:tetratricopeptide (TPR) repeat protein